ncbi:helix-turn-helix domain-containing protein [Streptomyces sp. NPDC057557]|uniref:helix-turn-helix domain-containing protein n=1 Tax=Streptomyces sp. NPDC057557 TaxID=3346167 RepID=UPI0036B3CD50
MTMPCASSSFLFFRRATRAAWTGAPLAHAPERVIARRGAIGNRIRFARLHANLSQEQVAPRAGMTLAPYNRIEQGHSAALIDSLSRIADAIGVPLADLVRE